VTGKTWCVYHLIHVRTPYQYIPKLVIAEAPEGEAVTTDLLERAGYQFGEFGIPWANHVLEQVDVQDAPSDLVARLRRGEGKWIIYDDLVKQANAPL